MGTIKDIVDLVTQASESVKDRKIASELLQIQTLALKLQAEQASLHEANIELREERQYLKDKIRSLESKIEGLSKVSSSGPVDNPTCPNCSTNSKPFYLSPIPSFASDDFDATHECTQCKTFFKIKVPI